MGTDVDKRDDVGDKELEGVGGDGERWRGMQHI